MDIHNKRDSNMTALSTNTLVNYKIKYYNKFHNKSH